MSEHAEATGSCLCGAVSFEAHGEPIWVLHCHCKPCRKQSGAPVATWISYPMDHVRWTGERSFFESSPGVRRGFCAQCGTPMSYEGERAVGETHLQISAFDDPEAFRPERHVFMSEKIGWFDVHDSLPRWAGGTGSAPEPLSHAPIVE